jgi:O-antigen/teichoic acid export membrane protein
MPFFKNVIIYLFGDILGKLIPFLLLPYLTINLGTEGYGELSYYNIILAFGYLILGINQGGTVTRYYHYYGARGVHGLIAVLFCSSLLICLVPLIYFIITSQYILAIIILSSFFHEAIASQLAFRQCKEKPIAYISINLSISALSLIFTVLLFEIIEASPELRISSIFLSYFIVFLFCFSKLNFKLILRKKKYFKIWAVFSLSLALPMFLHHLSIFSKGQIDKLFINEFYSQSMLGVYSTAFQICSIFAIVSSGVNKAINPYIFKKLKSKEMSYYDIQKFSTLSIFVIFFIYMILFILPYGYLERLLGPDFTIGEFIPSLSLGFMLMFPCALVMNYFVFYGHHKVIASCTIISTVIYVLYLFISKDFGVIFLSYGVAVSNFSSFLLLSLYGYVKFKN